MRSLRAGRWGAAPVADTCESEPWEKKLRNRRRGQDAEDRTPGRSFVSSVGDCQGLSPLRWVPTWNYSSTLLKSKSVFFQVNNPHIWLHKWTLTLWKISLRNKICLRAWSRHRQAGPRQVGENGPGPRGLPVLLRASFFSRLSVVPSGSMPSGISLLAFSYGLLLYSFLPEKAGL